MDPWRNAPDLWDLACGLMPAVTALMVLYGLIWILVVIGRGK